MKPDLTLPGIAHDLNNVFQTLVDAADRLTDDPRHAEVSSLIFRSIERGQRITRSLTEGASSAPLTAVVSSAQAFVADSGASSIRFVCDIDSELEMRQGWAWERVFINLFMNSCRAMPQGGTIYVYARREGLTVTDEGCGIPVEMLQRIFEPHVSGHGSSGLGLHIVKSIVEQDGGSIQAVNAVRGAEFTICLPASALVARIRTAHAGT